jgi:integrase/recombinase XerD
MPIERRCLPFSQWPEADQLAWIAGTRQVALFEAAGAGAHWARHSRRKVEHGYGHWLAWLHRSQPLHAVPSPALRVSRRRVADYIAALSTTCAPYTQVCRIQELYDAMRVLAPGEDWQWLAEVLAALRRGAAPIRNKRLRLRRSRELVALGLRLITEAEQTEDWSAQRRAVRYRDGLMIALLAYRPMRLRNFASIRLGRQLLKKEGWWWLTFPADEMKAKQSYDARFPRALVPALERYLDQHRPILLAGEGQQAVASIDALWVSEVATMLEEGALATRIRTHTQTAFGASIPPHWFRDAAATSIAIEDPVHVRDAHLLLGNTLAVMEKHYNQAQSLEASRRHHAMLATLRASLKPSDT